MEQLTIFDIIQESELEYPDFKEMTSKQIACFIGDIVGIDFKPSKIDPEWQEATINKVEFRVFKDIYAYEGAEGVPFISCDVQRKYGHFEGRGAPIDDLESAVNWFKKNKTYFLGK